MRAALQAAVGARAALVFVDTARDVDAIAAAPRDSGVVLVVIEATVAPLDRAMLCAAIGPLAVALAPQTRLVALDLADDADSAAAAAAAHYLLTASSTTGQIVRIAPDA
ncbi:hypothetical protein U1872_17485 [Sphingomonas sp. RB3P16]|uniref:Rossmann fold domain-containing protein n=1 Tax=Parasphingomonas frigoris TaxID=3096163 RepID=UPI002FC96E95